ncbi:hypothetical protein HDV06_003768 [Boothiomyces sp. JEL0866]|nr:hypothetical protein HDV06_003768 [Boothiomyces sp. JEL0866]
MKFGEYLTQNLVPEWKHKYINYNQLKYDIKHMELSHIASSIKDQHDDWTRLVNKSALEDDVFIIKFHGEVRKVERFMQDKLSWAMARFDNIRLSCLEMSKHTKNLEQGDGCEIDGGLSLQSSEILDSTFQRRLIELKPRGDSSQTLPQEHLIDLPEQETRPQNPKQTLNHKKVKKQIHQAICEYYLFLELLSNYRVLNEMATQKILKKFSKRRNIDTERLKDIAFEELRKDEIKVLLENTLDLYVEYFESNRRAAMEILKPKEYTVQTMDVYVTGLLTGFSVPILGYIISNIEYSFTVFIYAGLSVPIFFLYLFSLCILVFQMKKINWILIFELDPKCKSS